MDNDLKIIYSVWIFVFAASITILPLISASPDLTDNLISYYKLDETSGTTSVDSVSNINMTHDVSSLGVTGIINTAYNFTGTEQADGDSNLDLGVSKSVCLWWRIYSYTDQPTPHPFMIGTGTSADAFGFFLPATGRIFLWGGSGNDFDTGTDVTLGVWEHWCAIYDGTVYQAYYNGVSIKNQTVALTTSNSPLTVNSRNDAGDRGMLATYDEIYVRNESMTSAEVEELYGSGTPPPYPFVVDTCTCAGAGNDWEIAMSDYCRINDDCNLGTGTLSFTGAGWTDCNAAVNTTNMGDPGATGILYVNSSCAIVIN